MTHALTSLSCEVYEITEVILNNVFKGVGGTLAPSSLAFHVVCFLLDIIGQNHDFTILKQ